MYIIHRSHPDRSVPKCAVFLGFLFFTMRTSGHPQFIIYIILYGFLDKKKIAPSTMPRFIVLAASYTPLTLGLNRLHPPTVTFWISFLVIPPVLEWNSITRSCATIVENVYIYNAYTLFHRKFITTLYNSECHFGHFVSFNDFRNLFGASKENPPKLLEEALRKRLFLDVKTVSSGFHL